MAYRPDYFANNKDRYAYYGIRYRDGLREEMVQAYGGCCQRCKENDPLVLSLDHIFDDAEYEKDLYGLNARGGHKHYARLKQEGWPKERFQLLCYNCNAKKEHARRRAKMKETNGEEKVSTPQTRSLAHANIPAPKHNTSGIKGVFWNSQKRKWQAKAMVNYKNQYLGFYDKIEDAAKAYKEFAIATWGQSANFATEMEVAAAMKRESEMDRMKVESDLNPEDLGF